MLKIKIFGSKNRNTGGKWKKPNAKRQIEEEKWERKKNELNAFKLLLMESERWQKIKIMRSYINDVELMIQDKPGDHVEIHEWINWAKNKVNWYDPFLNQEDELLEDVDRDTLEFKKKPHSSIWGEHGQESTVSASGRNFRAPSHTRRWLLY